MKSKSAFSILVLGIFALGVIIAAFTISQKQTSALTTIAQLTPTQPSTTQPAQKPIPQLPKPNTNLVKHLFNINGIHAPKGIAISRDSKEIWVTSLLNKNNGVAVYNFENKKIADIALGTGGGVETIFSADGSKAYVSQMETGKVFEVDTLTKKVLRTFNTKSTWTKILLISADGKKLYASNWVGNNVSEISLETGLLIRNIPTVKTPRGIYVTKDNAFLYVAGYERGEIQKIDLKTGKGKVIYKSGGAMRHVVADEEKGILYLSDMGRATILKLTLATDTVEKFATTDTNPNTIALSPDKKILIVSCRGKNFSADDYYQPGPEWGTVLLFDTTDGKLLDAVIGGNQPTALDISPDGTKFIFSDFLDDRLQVFELPKYEDLKNGGGGLSKVYKGMIKKKK